MDRSKFPTIHVCRFNSGHKYYIPQYKGVDIVNKLKYTGGEFEVRKKKGHSMPRHKSAYFMKNGAKLAHAVGVILEGPS